MASSSTNDYKRKRDDDQGPSSQPPPYKWRTRRAQELYSSKLLDALRLVRAAPARGHDVRDAADRALAAAARGRSRWSRAILARRRRQRQRQRSATLLRGRRPRAPMVPAGCSSSQGLQVARKAKVLGRLVPGCRKVAFPALLAEVSDYIAALEMQVRTMTAVAQALASVSSTPPGSASPS